MARLEKNEAAVAQGLLGGLKGSKARADRFGRLSFQRTQRSTVTLNDANFSDKAS
jgi:hypothetical protein